jgi:HSP20 family protein
MHDVNRVLDEVKSLYTKVLGMPAPDIGPGYFAPFPPGVDPLEHVAQEIQQLKGLSERMAAAPGPVAWVPQADTFATPDSYVIRVEAPGVEREELKVFVQHGECVVRGQRKPPATATEIGPVAFERPWGPFERRFPLPAGCYPDRVTARYAQGVVEIRVAHEGTAKPQETKVELA